MLRHLYRAVVPAFIRRQVSLTREALSRAPHELRWALTSAESISRWTERRLELQRHYWLFILGCNNSGTTVLMRILESHPLIRTLPGEGQGYTNAIPSAARLGVSRTFSQRLELFRLTEEHDPTPAARMRYDWAPHYRPGPGILLEKTPTNVVRSRWLQHSFRPSRFVGIVRSPYAVCEGIRRRTGTSIEEAAHHWRRVHEILLEDVGHLERCLLVRYEDLCDRPEEHCERIARFLELDVPFDLEVIGRDLTVPNIDETPHALSSFNDKSLRRLSPRDIEIIGEITEIPMRRWGYQPPA
jgi:hypothetical protein